MVMARVTSKGQVTIPVEVRKSLGIKAGDGLLFEAPRDDGMARFRVVRQRRLPELAGALPATRSYPGKEAVREEVGRTRGRERSRRPEP